MIFLTEFRLSEPLTDHIGLNLNTHARLFKKKLAGLEAKDVVAENTSAPTAGTAPIRRHVCVQQSFSVGGVSEVGYREISKIPRVQKARCKRSSLEFLRECHCRTNAPVDQYLFSGTKLLLIGSRLWKKKMATRIRAWVLFWRTAVKNREKVYSLSASGG